MAQLILFTKHDCPLCDELKDRLSALHLDYEERLITTRPDWYLRYRFRVPVVRLPDATEVDPPFDSGTLRKWRRLYG